MNIFSVLDTSDNEEETRVPPKKGKDAPAKQDAGKKDAAQKPAAAKPADNKAKAETAAPANNKPTKTTDKPKAAPKPDEAGEGDIHKDNNRGGRPRGKEGSRHGERNHNEKKKEPAAVEGEEKREHKDHGRKPKRDFERRSGTGRGKELAKGGRGSYGFGNVDQEAADAEKDPNIIEQAVAEGTHDAEAPADPETEVVPEEPKPAVFTLDEYMQKREEARAKSALLAAEKQARSVDKDTQFEGLVAKEDNLAAYIEGKTKNVKSKEKRSGKEQVLDVGFKIQSTTTYEPRRDYREQRGGRGGGRHGGRDSKRSQAPAAVFNSVDFPSL